MTQPMTDTKLNAAHAAARAYAAARESALRLKDFATRQAAFDVAGRQYDAARMASGWCAHE